MSDAKQPNKPAESKTASAPKAIQSKPTQTKPIKQNAAPAKPKNTRSNTIKKVAKKTSKKVTQSKPAVKTASEEVTLTEPIQTDKQARNQTSQAAQTNTTPAAQSAPSSGKGIAWFALLLSLGALGGSGFTWYQTKVQQVQSNSSLAVGVSEIGGQVARLGDSMARLQQEQSQNISAEQAENRLKASLLPLQQEQQALNESIQKVTSEMQSEADKFVLEEVAQLLKVANYSVSLNGNTESGIKALSLADAQLKQLTDPRYSLVRTKINEEMVQLKNVKVVDNEAISSTLNSIVALIPSLPLANEPVSKPIAKEEESDEPVTWRTELNKFWEDIKGEFKIQRVDQPPKPLLAPEQRYFLNQNLQINLNKAELALLQSESDIYQRSLASSITWLRDYFDLKDDRVNTVITQLSELQNQSLEASLPDISGSYDALQGALNR